MAFCVVLDSPENPDNIGAVARAMKNMGAGDLRLVNPPAGWREMGKKMAVGASDLLSEARIFESLKDAVGDTCFVLGTTRRFGTKRRVFLEFDKAIDKVRCLDKKSKAAIVFGRESKGLSNESLRVCDWYTAIPSNPEFPSINLAQAVMIFCFSLYGGHSPVKGLKYPSHVRKDEFESAMEVFRKAIIHLQYKPDLVSRIDATFRAMIKRGGLIKSEAQMIKGISRRICERSVKKRHISQEDRSADERRLHG